MMKAGSTLIGESSFSGWSLAKTVQITQVQFSRKGTSLASDLEIDGNEQRCNVNAHLLTSGFFKMDFLKTSSKIWSGQIFGLHPLMTAKQQCLDLATSSQWLKWNLSADRARVCRCLSFALNFWFVISCLLRIPICEQSDTWNEIGQNGSVLPDISCWEWDVSSAAASVWVWWDGIFACCILPKATVNKR